MALTRVRPSGLQARQERRQVAPGVRPRATEDRRAATALMDAAPVQSSDLSKNAGTCPVLSSLRPLPPTPGAVSTFIKFMIDPIKTGDEIQFRGNVTTTRGFGVIPMVSVGDMAAARDVISQESSGNVTVGWPVATKLLLGEESVTAMTDSKKHQFMRRLLAPALGPEAVERYLPEIHQIVTNTLDEWVAYTAHTNKPALAMPGAKNMTLRVITSVALDMNLNDEQLSQLSKDFNIWVKNLFALFPINRWPFPFHESMQARQRLVAVIEQRVKEVQSVIAGGQGTLKPKSTLKQLLTTQDEHGNTLTHKQVIDNLLNLLFAGHDTTSSQVVRLLYILALHPQVLDRVRAEQSRIISRHGPAMTPAALKDMVYAQAVLSESMRMEPVVGGSIRSVKSDIGVQGYLVPQSSTVMMNYQYMMRHDPRWPHTLPLSDQFHPSKFNPDRFMTEEGSKQGAQVPFGMGGRTCAGIALAQAEATIFLATLARGYIYTADTNTKWIRQPIIRPANDLPVFMERL